MPVDFAGAPMAVVVALDNPECVAALGAITFPAARSVHCASVAISGARGVEARSPTAVRHVAGTFAPSYGSERFEKIILEPRMVALGGVVADVTSTVAVWNSSIKAASLPLTAISAAGPGNVGLPALTLPDTLDPGEVIALAFDIPADGDPTIDETVVLEFAGVSSPATSIVFSGLRVQVFAFDHDWAQGVKERSAFLTWVFSAYSDDEQRVQLRKTPRPMITFRVFTTSAEDSAELEALIYGWQARVFGVPLWQDAQPLAAPVADSDLTIAVDTTDRLFVPGGLAMLWRDPRTSLAFAIVSTTDSSLTLAAPVGEFWPADGRTLVVPLAVGRLSAQFQVQRTGDVAQADVVFACEVA